MSISVDNRQIIAETKAGYRHADLQPPLLTDLMNRCFFPGNL